MANSSHCSASRQRSSDKEITSLAGTLRQSTCLSFALDFDSWYYTPYTVFYTIQWIKGAKIYRGNLSEVNHIHFYTPVFILSYEEIMPAIQVGRLIDESW